MQDLFDRMWTKTQPIPESGCWIWMGCLMSNGYGKIGINYESLLVHRVSYELLVEKIMPNWQLDHKCRVRSCWNPNHLEQVTQHENLLRGEGFPGKNSRKTHCKNGHLLTGDNLYIRSDRPNTRECRICRNKYAKTYNKENWWRY